MPAMPTMPTMPTAATTTGATAADAPAVALVGLVPALSDVLVVTLAGEGYAPRVLPLDADAVRLLAQAPPRAVVFDGHAFANTRAFLSDLRARPETAAVPVVVLGPARPDEVPRFEVVFRLGRTVDLPELLAAVQRATGRLDE
jgi:hypothetical protein